MASPPEHPLTASEQLQPNQGWSTLGKVLGKMKISAAKKQVLQSIAGVFPSNAVLHKWGVVLSAACALCSHPAETQSHIKYLCPALKEAWIWAHHNMAQLLCKETEDSTNGWIIVTQQTVAGLQGLQQPEEQIDAWQLAWDEVTDELLEGDEVQADADMAVQQKRPDAWAVSWENLLLQ